MLGAQLFPVVNLGAGLIRLNVMEPTHDLAPSRLASIRTQHINRVLTGLRTETDTVINRAWPLDRCNRKLTCAGRNPMSDDRKLMCVDRKLKCGSRNYMYVNRYFKYRLIAGRLSETGLSELYQQPITPCL